MSAVGDASAVQQDFVYAVFSDASATGVLRTRGLAKAIKNLSSSIDFQPVFGQTVPKNDRQRLVFLSTLVQKLLQDTTIRQATRTMCLEIDGVIKRSEIAIAQANIAHVAKHAHRALSDFHVEQITIAGARVDVVKVNGLVRRLFYALFSTKAMAIRRQRQVLDAIGKSVTIMSSISDERFVVGGEVTRQFVTAQRYNQAIAASKGRKGSIAAAVAEKPIESHNPTIQRELASAEATTTVTHGKKSERPVQKRGRFQYPGEDRDHQVEARRIFFATVAELVSSLFKKQARYFRGGVTARTIRASDAPMRVGAESPSSYWIGHSTCLMTIPLHAQEGGVTKSFTVITDPIEGDLAPLLYPRKTEPGRKISQVPAIHVMMLSHNHLDHYSEKTLKKLLSLQPVMIVPEGDGKLFTAMGFTSVKEQNWWDKVDITLSSGGKQYAMSVTAVPSHHWAGRGIRGIESAFIGQVISGAEGGDIYYAGDTARLIDEHIQKLRERFNIRWMYQPGGPDTPRPSMESTHQASADSLWMHMELFLKKLLPLHRTKSDFLKAGKACKTVIMHTSTYKLGTLHAADTKESIARVIDALRGKPSKLTPQEQTVFDELCVFCDRIHFDDGPLTHAELAQLLEETVYVPKIGARIDFEKGKPEHEGRLQL
jgi:L-ascorbate metabolism protein UlaG (beta-lactamase superfamily)